MFVFIAALSDKFNVACRSASMLVCLVVDSGYIHTYSTVSLMFAASWFLYR